MDVGSVRPCVFVVSKRRDRFKDDRKKYRTMVKTHGSKHSAHSMRALFRQTKRLRLRYGRLAWH